MPGTLAQCTLEETPGIQCWVFAVEEEEEHNPGAYLDRDVLVVDISRTLASYHLEAAAAAVVVSATLRCQTSRCRSVSQEKKKKKKGKQKSVKIMEWKGI